MNVITEGVFIYTIIITALSGARREHYGLGRDGGEDRGGRGTDIAKQNKREREREGVMRKDRPNMFTTQQWC